MTTCTPANKANPRTWPVRGVAGCLALAASPTFALMAWIGANHSAPVTFCSSVSRIAPVDGMTAMYLLMSVFHLSPWLKLVAAHPRAHT